MTTNGRMQREVAKLRRQIENTEARITTLLASPEAHAPDHVCGLSGFGAPGDTCPACEWWARRRNSAV